MKWKPRPPSALGVAILASLALPSLAAAETTDRDRALEQRVAEFQRLASHCMAVGAFTNDTGAWQTPVMWCFREREKILDLLESVTGSRLTYCYYRFGGLCNDVDDAFVTGVRDFVAYMRPRLDM